MPMLSRKFLALLVVLGLFPGAAGANVVFLIADENAVLIGLNEDYVSPQSKMTLVPSKGNRYGAVYFGFDSSLMRAGVNEKGLFFSWAATPPVQLNLIGSGKELFEGDITEKLMEECASVSEALALLDRYQSLSFDRNQLFLGDSNGDSAVVEGDATIKKHDNYQIMTNFRQSRKDPKTPRSMKYLMADKLLIDGPVTVEHLRTVLDITHQEAKVPTQYSMICDVKAGKIHLFHFHSFVSQILIDYGTELKKGSRSFDIPALFPKTYAFEAFKREWESRTRVNPEKKKIS